MRAARLGRVDAVATGGDQTLQLLDAAARPISPVPAEATALPGATSWRGVYL